MTKTRRQRQDSNDIGAVVLAVDNSLVAIDGAVTVGAVYAATHPSRTTALVVLEGYADTQTAMPDVASFGEVTRRNRTRGIARRDE